MATREADDMSSISASVAKRTKLTQVACDKCRSRKSKCDGSRPVCGKCIQFSTKCVYIAEAGETRGQSIHRANRELQEQLDSYKALFEHLRSGSTDVRVDILAQLTANEPPEEILRRFNKNYQLPVHENATARSSRQQGKHRATDAFEEGGIADGVPALAHAGQEITSTATEDLPQESQVFATSHLNPQAQAAKAELLQRFSCARVAGISDDTQRQLPTGAVHRFGNLPLSSAVQANHYPMDVQVQQMLNLQTHEYAIPSCIWSDNTPMSNLFFSFRDGARKMIANGTPAHVVIGHAPQFDVELFFRDRNDQDPPHNADSWACEVLKSVSDFDIFVLLASCALYTAYMRWNILPTAELYALMPPMIRPTRHQRCLPHAMPLDLVPHPVIREALLGQYRDWLSPGTLHSGATSVGWPYSIESAVSVDSLTGRRVLTNAFIEHATNPDNWSLDKSIRDMYPEIDEDLGFRIRH
ncbi:hypothetical protein M501DRAFT_932018 [Patellaria atrata CBS 101060]|uniref:Zn(2)-C6 fungal-type domain-containing protein n=1 Tax=Patellaria atrata CBS 101060 TaxID=1346257 RepID=A0A9P4VNR5_9PEZI|nr:hypothetical protein M501DRAFT_932018 [Patellaria atrata CBS 101060]